MLDDNNTLAESNYYNKSEYDFELNPDFDPNIKSTRKNSVNNSVYVPSLDKSYLSFDNNSNYDEFQNVKFDSRKGIYENYDRNYYKEKFDKYINQNNNNQTSKHKKNYVEYSFSSGKLNDFQKSLRFRIGFYLNIFFSKFIQLEIVIIKQVKVF